MKIFINDRPYEFKNECTILEACSSIGIDVPHLCSDPRTEHFTSCYLCVVEVDGAKGLTPSCSTNIKDGMSIRTNTDEVLRTRKLNLELLLSDHSGDCIAPCSMTCPAGIDIQTYLAHVANKDYESAIKVIKERDPFPVVCGRVCPRPCETDCRRGLIDEAVAIDNVKRFVSDVDANKKHPYAPKVAKDNSKKVAIVGAGPAGLTCAYYLRIEGYKVDVYESTNKPGGMLMWGIPEYRLPKKTLMKEIEVILSLGVNVLYNKTLGKDISIDGLKGNYDAVFIAIGAQNSSRMCVINEDSKGVYGGVDFLAEVAKGELTELKGKKIIVVGGGNTAIDAARTSVRLGAERVTLVYRRTRSEMPAEKFEIHGAEEEGVELKFLRAPIEVVQDGASIRSLKCQVMQLGEQDASGRRKPVPVDGKQEHIDCDIVIAAIGQQVDTKGLNGLDLTKWNTIKVDEKNRTYKTNIDGVFAGGDVVSGPYIAIAAIAQGLLASKSIDSYLTGKQLNKDKNDAYIFSLGKKLDEVDASYIPLAKKVKRGKPKELLAKNRINNFKEVEATFSESQAIKEANRCLNCGCLDYDECSLIKYAEQYKADMVHIKGDKRERFVDDSSDYLVLDTTKCIKCGKCIRVCDELKGIGALGFVNRGFNTSMMPALGDTLISSSCVECGQCEVACPTGAILDKPLTLKSMAQFNKTNTDTICKECSLGCPVTIHFVGTVPVKITPQHVGTVNEPMLCKLGRYDALKDYKRSFKFDDNKYKKLKLRDARVDDVFKNINDAKTIINYDVDVFNYFTPISYYLKRILDKDKNRAKNILFYLKKQKNIYGLSRYGVNVLPKAPDLKEFTSNDVLIIVEEANLNEKEIKKFLELKKLNNVKILSLAKRT